MIHDHSVVMDSHEESFQVANHKFDYMYAYIPIVTIYAYICAKGVESNTIMHTLNPYQRYQTGLTMEVVFPKQEQACACGCGNSLKGRQKKWASDPCRKKALRAFQIIKGDTEVIRAALLDRDLGYCRNCGVSDDRWHADHIIPVHGGGGACSLDNFQTLCGPCHKEKTLSDRVPNGHNVLAGRLNIIPPAFDGSGAWHQGISKHIVR